MEEELDFRDIALFFRAGGAIRLKCDIGTEICRGY